MRGRSAGLRFWFICAGPPMVRPRIFQPASQIQPAIHLGSSRRYANHISANRRSVSVPELGGLDFVDCLERIEKCTGPHFQAAVRIVERQPENFCLQQDASGRSATLKPISPLLACPLNVRCSAPKISASRAIFLTVNLPSMLKDGQHKRVAPDIRALHRDPVPVRVAHPSLASVEAPITDCPTFKSRLALPWRQFLEDMQSTAIGATQFPGNLPCGSRKRRLKVGSRNGASTEAKLGWARRDWNWDPAMSAAKYRSVHAGAAVL